LSEVLGGYPGRVLGLLVFLTKSSLLVVVQIWVRWTLPRLRIDQVMETCLKYLVPISCFLFIGSVMYPLVLLSALGRPTLLPVNSIGTRVPVLPAAAVPVTPPHEHPHDHSHPHDHNHGHGPGEHSHGPGGHSSLDRDPAEKPAAREVTLRGGR
jgi:NADH-quinone oxidoreductase subunit H